MLALFLCRQPFFGFALIIAETADFGGKPRPLYVVVLIELDKRDIVPIRKILNANRKDEE